MVCVALIYLIEWSEWSKKDIQEKRRKTWWKFSHSGSSNIGSFIQAESVFHPTQIQNDIAEAQIDPSLLNIQGTIGGL